MRKSPRILYKYRCFEEHHIQALLDGKVWSADLRSFNDPFEFHFGVDLDLSLEQVQRYDALANSANYLLWQMEEAERIRSKFRSGGAHCLSEDCDISLMWSHYAGGHSGFCVGYGVRESNDLGNGMCSPVVYGDKLPRFKLSECLDWGGVVPADALSLRSAELVRNAMCFSKDENWAYEKEWRISYLEKDQLVDANFKPVSITFGMRMPKEERSELKERLKDMDVEYWAAHMPKDSYTMRIEKEPYPAPPDPPGRSLAGRSEGRRTRGRSSRPR
jgi:hypothetical protein